MPTSSTPDVTARLEEWLAGCEAGFPSHTGIPHPRKYANVRDHLNANVHPHVEKGALLHGDGYLTNHGVEHVRTVISRAGDLIGDPAERPLEAYEVYLLLMAAHFHDVGNIFGREGHEKRAASIMEHLSQHIDDTVERRIILGIASAHSGNVDGDKDTISRLPATEFNRGVRVRIHALAALLRFADELADDRDRASRFPMALGVVPPSSRIFHEYAKSLTSVFVDRKDEAVDLAYDLYMAEAVQKYPKAGRKIFLLDEIYSRTLKMHAERLYCMRYMREVAPVRGINVQIRVFVSESQLAPKHAIKYSLSERGYPAIHFREFASLCPEVEWTGAKLRRALVQDKKSR
jgi:hypothetical protein